MVASTTKVANLNVDKLDDLDSLDFVRATNNINETITGNKTFSNAVTSDTLTYTRSTSLLEDTDLNTVSISGFYDINITDAGIANSPETGWSYLQVQRHTNDNGYVAQYIRGFGGIQEMYHRSQNGGIWGSWIKLYDSNNLTATDINNLGIDADTLDTYDSSQFLRSDVDDTASGNLTFTGTNTFNTKTHFDGGSADTIEIDGTTAQNVGISFQTDSIDEFLLYRATTRDLILSARNIDDVGTSATAMRVNYDTTIVELPAGMTTNTIDATGTINTTSTISGTNIDVNGNTTGNAETATLAYTIDNNFSTTAGLIAGFMNDGGGNLGFRFNADGGATNLLVENGQAYELEIANDVNGGDFSIKRGTTASGTAGDAITWNEAFRIEGTTGAIHADQGFVGGLTGNASTATKWATARTITLGTDLSGNVSIDGSQNVTLDATVNVTGSLLTGEDY